MGFSVAGPLCFVNDVGAYGRTTLSVTTTETYSVVWGGDRRRSRSDH